MGREGAGTGSARLETTLAAPWGGAKRPRRGCHLRRDPAIVLNASLPRERAMAAGVCGRMARKRPCYEIFPAQAVMDRGRVRVAWAWQHIARSGAVRHATLYDTFADCLAAIARRSGRNAPPAVRVVLDPAMSMSRKIGAAGDAADDDQHLARGR